MNPFSDRITSATYWLDEILKGQLGVTITTFLVVQVSLVW